MKLCPYCNKDPNDQRPREAIIALCRIYKNTVELVNPGGRELKFMEPIGRIQLMDYCFWCDLETIKEKIGNVEVEDRRGMGTGNQRRDD